MDTSKIIKGVVNSGRYTVTAPIVKEDYGLKLKIEGVELPSTYQVDFSNNENSGSSVTMIGNSDGVLIPSQFISTGKDVFAFLYHVGEDYGRTVYKFRIPNKVRPDRTEETPTPEEQSTIDQAISALNSAVEQTAQDVESASQSAQSAESAKTAAESARDTAGEYANDAESSAASASTSASQANTSATASAQSASQSAQIKAGVEDLVDDAQSYAESALIASQASVTARNTAQGYAQSASASAQSASGYASAAQTSANTASSKATEASTSAQTASAKATESAQSASQALSYKTDAESAKTASQTAQGLAESARNSAISAKDDAESARDEAQNLVDGISGKVEQIDSNTERIESLEDDRYKPYVVDTASGSIASFPDGADDLPLKSLVVDINPVQDLHGQDAPYPAGGGKNLLIQMPQKTSVINGVTWTINSDGSISANGTASGASTFTYISSEQGVEFNGDYKYLQFPAVATQVMSIGIRFDRWVTVYPNVATSITGVTGKIVQMWFQIKDGQTANITFYPMIYKASESAPTAWSPYENICPISGWTQTGVEQSGVNLFDESIFANSGGVLQNSGMYYFANVIPLLNKVFYENNGYTGQLSITLTRQTEENRQSLRVTIKYTDGTTEKVGNQFATGGVDTYTVVTSAGKVVSKIIGDYGSNFSTYAKLQIELGSTATPYSPYTGRSITINLGQTVYGGKLDVLSGELVVYPYYASYNGETLTGEWISDRDKYVSGTTPTIGAQVVNIGAQGVTVQLEPHEVESLYGVNNIWADSGDTEVEYRADTKAYIAKKIAEALASLT